MQQKLSLRLAELLASRLCHDLISPIGAINTGLELYHETLPEQLPESSEILNLVSNSARTASARVSFYRVAFGRSGGATSLEQAKDLIDQYFVRSKLQLHWNNASQKNMLHQEWGRILLNAVLWISECAPRGGVLELNLPQKGLFRLALCLKADPIILHQGTLEALEGKFNLEDITPRTAPCYLLHCIIKGENGKLAVSKTSSPSELFLEIDLGLAEEVD